MDLQKASVEIEKLVKSGEESTLLPDNIEQTLMALENALGRAVESIGVLGLPEKDAAREDIGGTSVPMDPVLAQETAQRLREAVDMGDIMGLSRIAGELKAQSDSLAPLCDKIAQMAEDFDLDGILKLANDLEVND
jgi:hypothetical protein